jgi:hypothetical protein
MAPAKSSSFSFHDRHKSQWHDDGLARPEIATTADSDSWIQSHNCLCLQVQALVDERRGGTGFWNSRIQLFIGICILLTVPT